MAGVQRLNLSGSTDGRPILVAATSTPGTAVHTGVSGSTNSDEVWLWACNTDTSARTLTIDLLDAGTNIFTLTIPPESGLVLVLPGLSLYGGQALTAYASAANVVILGGYVNRLTVANNPTSQITRPASNLAGNTISITATSTPGTTVHTALSSNEDDEHDEIWIWAYNRHSAPVKLTIEWGGTTSPNDTIEVSIPNGAGLVPVIPGLILQNSLVVRAFAGTTAVIRLWGYINRIQTP